MKLRPGSTRCRVCGHSTYTDRENLCASCIEEFRLDDGIGVFRGLFSIAKILLVLALASLLLWCNI